LLVYSQFLVYYTFSGQKESRIQRELFFQKAQEKKRGEQQSPPPQAQDKGEEEK